MRKVQLIAVVLTLVIAAPFTTLSILLSAYITNNMAQIAGFLANIPQNFFNIQRNLLLEIEIIGLIAGTLIFLSMLAIALRYSNSDDTTSA